MTTTPTPAKNLVSDPNAPWPSQIPEISINDPVLGNTNGPVNIPHQLLFNGMLYLKRHLEALTQDFYDASGNFSLGNLPARVQALEEAASLLHALASQLTNRADASSQSLEEIIADIAALKARVADLESKSLYVFAFTCS